MIEECLVVEFAVTGDDCPLAVATRRTGSLVDAQPPQRRTDGNALLRFSAPAGTGLREALDADDRIRYLHASHTDGRTNYRCLSRHPCVVHALVDVGFLVDTIQYRRGRERYTGAVVGYDVLEGVLEAAGETVGVTLERVYPLGGEDEEAVAQRWDLTPAQEAAIRTAYERGYFSVPKEATAAEVAADLGIGKSAFLERLRRGQAAIFRQLFG
ncbi:helix-turn-helix domain-containing protein [Natrononativus amylolyticus]|uniref:helix-turn-helix domain-containing protein n=1 Tax=Natrononativus amylolyticus TaxID=2963434 RepID=UPI0020CE8467|nr:helix-turn-helix domain-containing protein [Natrononativus amylolyticus]